jgi:succinate-semialdehyde dehydrogenase/glutarate-semialdehyde dehydrogenase
MKYATISPLNNELIQEFDFDSYPDLNLSQKAFNYWRKLSVEERGHQLKKVAALLHQHKRKYAELITLEMGKPVAEAEYEITKVITAFDYYIAHAPHILKPVEVKTQASRSYIVFEPLGIIFSIMPWNFPFWQVFRFAVPTLIAGNVSILKHAPCVPQCAKAIEALFHEAGIMDGVFKNYLLNNDDAARLIAEPSVAGLSFTGSEATGSYLAEKAGKNLKKCVMELGGNDAFLVLEDADLDKTIAGAIKSRSINTGQSCNAAKRFIVVEPIADTFTNRLIEAVKKIKPGNPMEEGVQMGPLARKDLADKVKLQVADSIAGGAVAHYGTEVPAKGNFVRPTVLTGVKKGIRAFEEEVFGPVWSVIVVKDVQEAIATANDSLYGLGASIWTAKKEEAAKWIPELQTGNVFINDIVKSDARIPFGGVKHSGFGRELSEYGLREFVNIKTVYFN